MSCRAGWTQRSRRYGVERGDTGLGRDAYGPPRHERDRRGHGPGPYPSDDGYPAEDDDAGGPGRQAEDDEFGQLLRRPGEMPPRQPRIRQPGRPQPGGPAGPWRAPGWRAPAGSLPASCGPAWRIPGQRQAARRVPGRRRTARAVPARRGTERGRPARGRATDGRTIHGCAPYGRAASRRAARGRPVCRRPARRRAARCSPARCSPARCPPARCPPEGCSSAWRSPSWRARAERGAGNQRRGAQPWRPQWCTGARPVSAAERTAGAARRGPLVPAAGTECARRHHGQASWARAYRQGPLRGQLEPAGHGAIGRSRSRRAGTRRYRPGQCRRPG